MTRPLPIFPLGTVALPWTGVPLHVFEERYRRLMDDLTDGTVNPPEFGIVLIERGSEVGGGDQRSRVGTVVKSVAQKRLPDGRWFVLAAGTRRFRVHEWLPDAPYPCAHVEDLPEETWNPKDGQLVEEAARQIRHALALAVELGASSTDLEFDLSDDAVAAVWQLCGLAPLGAFDRQALLESPNPTARLERLTLMAKDICDSLTFRLSGE